MINLGTRLRLYDTHLLYAVRISCWVAVGETPRTLSVAYKYQTHLPQEEIATYNNPVDLVKSISNQTEL
jgi:hypothetical protein